MSDFPVEIMLSFELHTIVLLEVESAAYRIREEVGCLVWLIQQNLFQSFGQDRVNLGCNVLIDLIESSVEVWIVLPIALLLYNDDKTLRSGIDTYK